MAPSFDLNTPLLSCATALCLLIYHFIIHPVLVSPLSRIPNAHPTSSISPLWILWKRFRFEDAVAVHTAHEAKGPVVRLGPREISINCVKEGVRIVYAPAFDKSPWYSVMENFGHKNMVTMLSHSSHSIRKRMLSHIYSKSYLLSSTVLAHTTRTILQTRLLPYLRSAAASRTEVEVSVLFSAVAIDINTAYLFGLAAAPNYTQDLDSCRRFLALYHGREPWMVWKQEFSSLAGYIVRIGRFLSVKRNAARQQLEAMFLEWCDRAAEIYSSLSDPASCVKSSDVNDEEKKGAFPLVYTQLRSSIEKPSTKNSPGSVQVDASQRLEIAAELLDLLSAGFETSNMTLKDVIRRLCQNPDIQTALQTELRSLHQPLLSSSKMAWPDPTALDALPLLSAVLHETLRLHPPAPNGLPRLVPEGGCSIGGFLDIPSGIRVSAQAYSLHRNAEVFPEPQAWRPKRWIDWDGRFINGGEMHRWWWAFGSGGRMCIGSQFALYQMKYMIAAVYTNFKTRIAEEEVRGIRGAVGLMDASKKELMITFRKKLRKKALDAGKEKVSCYKSGPS
ncbi:cytochrome P450 [Lojkania enalia]|uniref:Cytochrome P450 n=1 Tax=Lojkania enalia TaxID=147567 RepID=A0A9P4MZZ7_9PLEO|nr:cytochrome P450 [Didymosphaeria enalia]